jgi:hypothetical protein
MRYSLILLLLFTPFAMAKAITPQEVLIKALKPQIDDVGFLVSLGRFNKPLTVQNRNGETLDTVKELDAKWITTNDKDDFKTNLLNNKTSQYLKQLVLKDESKYNEIFLADRQGALVAAYPLTSDYWQGDEAKFTESFNKGQGKVFVGTIKYDESTQTEAVQISFPIVYNKQCIGVLVIGVKVDHLREKLESTK